MGAFTHLLVHSAVCPVLTRPNGNPTLFLNPDVTLVRRLNSPASVFVQWEVARTHVCGDGAGGNQPQGLACLLPSPPSRLTCLEKIRVHLYL